MAKAQIVGDVKTSDTYPYVKVKCSCGKVNEAFVRSWHGNGKIICKGCGKGIEAGSLLVKDPADIKSPTSVRHGGKAKAAKPKKATKAKAAKPKKAKTAKATKPRKPRVKSNAQETAEATGTSEAAAS